MLIIKAECRLIQKGSLLAEATVTLRTELGDLNIKRCLIVDGKDGEPFVTLPQKQYQKDGQNKYQKLVYCSSNELKAKIDEACFSAYSEALKAEPVTSGKKAKV